MSSILLKGELNSSAGRSHKLTKRVTVGSPVEVELKRPDSLNFQFNYGSKHQPK